MDWLKKLIGEDNFRKLELTDSQKDELGKAKLFDPKEHIPKKDFNQKNDALKDLETEKTDLQKKLDAATNELNTIKSEREKGSQSEQERIEKLEKELGLVKEQASAKDKELLLEKNRSALYNNLTGAKANPKYLKTLAGEFDLENLKINDDGTIDGWDEKIKTLKEDKKELFGEMKLGGTPPASGGESDLVEMSAEDYYGSKLQ